VAIAAKANRFSSPTAFYALRYPAGEFISAGQEIFQPVGLKNMATAAFAKDQLRSFIERIERLEEERAALSADIREVYSEAKGVGFDTKIMRQVVRLRKLDKADYQEQEEILDLYLTAMDMR
jgi:uncharacterized protein (UPF0335 family)